jgi:hypothetical protein
MRSVLLKLARRVLEQVLNEVNRQVNRVEQEILQQMRNLITQGFDDVWRGEDADQFKEKVNNQAIRQAEGVVTITVSTHDGLVRAADVITRADQRVAQLVENLNNTFGRIY